MKYVGVKTTGELKLHEVKEPQTDEIYMAVEDTKLGAVPIRPYEFAKWDGTKWVKVDNVELATTLDIKNVKDEFAAIIPDDASEDNKLVTAADVAGVQEDVDAIEGKIPSDTSTTNKLVNESGLQDAIDNASESWSTGFTPKGESSVSDLNDLTAQSNGDSYIVTDSGTLTDGTLAVVAGDQVAWDATNSVWYKLPQYALKSAVDNISDSIATEFVPNSTTTVAGEPYMYDGKLYVANEAYSGQWNADKFSVVNVGELLRRLNCKDVAGSLDLTGATQIDYVINASAHWAAKEGTNYSSVVNVESLRGKRLRVVPTVGNAVVAFIKALKGDTDSVSFAYGETARHVVLEGGSEDFVIPVDCVYLYYVVRNNNRWQMPLLLQPSSFLKDTNDLLYKVADETICDYGHYVFQLGSVSSSNGGEVTRDGRLRTTFIDKSLNVIDINDSSLPLNVFFYAANKSYISPLFVDFAHLSGKIRLQFPTNAAYYRIVVATGEVPVVQTDVTNANKIKVYGAYSKDAPNVTPDSVMLFGLKPLDTSSAVTTEKVIDRYGYWQTSATTTGKVLDVSSLRGKTIVVKNRFAESIFAFIRDTDYTQNNVAFAGSYTERIAWVYTTSAKSFVIPQDCNYIFYYEKMSIGDYDVSPEFYLYDGLLSDVSKEAVNPDHKRVYYEGERVDIGAWAEFKMWKRLPNWDNRQGCAVFGNYLISLKACDELEVGETNGYLYNLSTGTLVNSMSFDSTLNGTTYSLPHANCVCFGKDYYNESSEFPLLYVSQVNGGSAALWAASERGCLVYDLQKQLDDTYVPVLVQVIRPDLSTAEKISEIEAKIGRYTPNYVVDTDNECIYILGYPYASWYSGIDEGMPVAKIPLPSADVQEYVFGASDVEDNFISLPHSIAIQQPVYYNGKIYMQGGVGGASSVQRGVEVIDLAKKKRTTYVRTSTLSRGEPQGLGLYNGKVIWYDAGTSGNIYELVFG